LQSERVDVVVSDMRMPGLDGAELLTRTRDAFPDVVRIALSGHTEPQTALRAVPVAHQFLAKPCDAASLEDVIRRSLAVRRLLTNAVLQQTLGGIDSLPSLPQLYASLTAALADPDVSLRQVARIIEQDVAMSSKVLQLANSAFFGRPQRVATIQGAVSFLGANALKALVLSIEVFRSFDDDPRLIGFSLADLERHAMTTAHVANRLLAGDRHAAEDAFLAGLLHDVGTLVLASQLTDEFAAILATARAHQREMRLVEADHLGVTHAEAGAYLLGLWGLPYPIVEAVAHHHDPTTVGGRRFDALAALLVADLLVDECTLVPPPPRPVAALEDYLDAFGLVDRLPVWRTLAVQHCAGAH
jgi:HD-like signal output (HDOD) protein